jgi:hypothetical protein
MTQNPTWQCFHPVCKLPDEYELIEIKPIHPMNKEVKNNTKSSDE